MMKYHTGLREWTECRESNLIKPAARTNMTVKILLRSKAETRGEAMRVENSKAQRDQMI